MQKPASRKYPICWMMAHLSSSNWAKWPRNFDDGQSG